jgi:site-specific DNA-methyltransferase (adenine-specific)
LAYGGELATVWHGDALDVLRTMADASVHAVVADPPYGLAKQSPKLVTDALGRWIAGDRGFVPGGSGLNGVGWDRFVPPPALWDEVLRVLKPGGHLLCFAAPRTQDLMGLSIRLAGFEIRDSILAWVNGQGFPKAQDLSKMIDKEDGATRTVTGVDPLRARRLGGQGGAYATGSGWRAGTRTFETSEPASARSAPWQGWAGALKPAQEPILMARKPLDGTLAHNAVTHGAGALHIDATRVPFGSDADAGDTAEAGSTGRWPPNLLVVHHPDCRTGGPCHPDCLLPELERQSADLRGRGTGARSFPTFHYAAKASAVERPTAGGTGHLTVKPLSVVAWLVDLVAAPGMVVLDPFAGSGPVVEVCLDAGVASISIEREDAYVPLILERIARAQLRRSGGLSA